MSDVFRKGSELLEKANERDLRSIASTQRSTREKAINSIIKPLDPLSKDDMAVFQTLPIEFLKRGDIIGAVWFIETVGKLGNSIDWSVVIEVIHKVIAERETCINQGDEESEKVMMKVLNSLFRMAIKHPHYKENEELYILMGNIEEIIENPYGAIKQYDVAIGLGSIEGYIASANTYESLGRDDMSVIILSSGYSIFKDIKILGRLISAYCKVGEKQKAMEYYCKLKEIEKDSIPPFIIYKGTIENDDELLELELIFIDYIKQGLYIPLESLHRLSISAGHYVADGAHRESQILDDLNKKDFEKWSDIDGTNYIESFQKRLFYMQIDCITLGNHRYIEYYLRDVLNFGIEGSPARRAILEDYYARFFSREVIDQVLHKDGNDNDVSDIEDQKNSEKSIGGYVIEKNKNGIRVNNVFESLSLHVSRIGEIFFNPCFYDIQHEQISTILCESAKLAFQYDDQLQSNIDDSFAILKNNSDYYYSLPLSTREGYESFINEFDTKYGVFFRRHIQNYAYSTNSQGIKYPESFYEYPDISYLFWIEKLLAGRFPTDNAEKIDEIVQQFKLDSVNIQEALIFGSLIKDLSIEYAVAYLVNYPHMLDVPQALYMVTDGLRSMDSRTRNECIRDLHILTQEEYGAEGFFEHIQVTFNDIDKSDPTLEDTEYMFLTRGNTAILEKKEKDLSILSFHTASQFGGVEGLYQAGESLMEIGEYEKALSLFQQALLQDDSITIMTGIINCSIISGRFDLAQQYINHSITKGYEIGNYIFAFHLFQGNNKEALLQMIPLIKSRSDIIDRPEGLFVLLKETLKQILNDDYTYNPLHAELQIFASFVHQNIIFSGIEADPEGILQHWNYISEHLRMLDGNELHSTIENVLSVFTGELPDEADMSDKSIAYIHVHADNCHKSLLSLLKSAQNEKNAEAVEKLLYILNNLCELVAQLLSHFPHSDNYVLGWRRGITLIAEKGVPDYMVQKMPGTIQ
ncbi:tetratricopeptide repeat protein [Candidatus Gracilibacteria bacterium]|nr:tetratricopeptide repeat protein [Candidatus Gracilibacteria bacterium]